MELVEILDDCLNRLQAGASLADCLAAYPEQAGELAPMLDAARQVISLRSMALPETARMQAKTALRRALLAERPARTARGSRFGWLLGPGRTRALALAGTVAVVACMAWMTTTVAASAPGDPAYGLRILAERAPALVQIDPEARAEAELSAAQRRLADLQATVTRSGKADPQALAALLASDEAAIQTATRLTPEQRARVAAILAAHRQQLQALAQNAPGTPAAEALNRAAERTHMAGDDAVQGSSEAPSSRSGAMPAASPTTGEPATPEPSPAPGGEVGGPMDQTPPTEQVPTEVAPDKPGNDDQGRPVVNGPDKRATKDRDKGAPEPVATPPGLSDSPQGAGPGPKADKPVTGPGNQPGPPAKRDIPPGKSGNGNPAGGPGNANPPGKPGNPQVQPQNPPPHGGGASGKLPPGQQKASPPPKPKH